LIYLSSVKIRTKLVLLLSTALVVIMGVSTMLRIGWTRSRLEDQLRASAKDSAEVIAAEINSRIKSEMDRDEIGEELAKIKLRHHVEDLELALDTEDDTVSTFKFPRNVDEALVAKQPRPARQRLQAQRRDDARRALYDHGETSRRPGERFVEPMWRTPDRPEPSRWPAHAVMEAPPEPRVVARTFREGERGRYPAIQVSVPVDPPGNRRGELILWFTREPIERTVRTEEISSILITGGAVILLMLIIALIVDRAVGRPVTELEAAMERVEAGALDERVDARRADEIGRLSRGFNAMLARLEQADADIRAFNRRLADEIAAATVDLNRKNAALAQLNRLLMDARRQLGDKERLAALGQLAAQLAHEIGTPLGSVSGHLQLALTARDVPAPLKDRLQVAGRELERVSKIVRDYLDSTRKVQPEKERVDLKRVVEEAVDLVTSDERRVSARVTTVIHADAAELETDPGLLRQILVNLLTNAVDAVAPDAGLVEVTTTPAAGGVALAVRDDGAGIAADDVARIFEPVYTTKGRGKGTGLGLAICRELASALGGRITVESAPGRGSTFTVTLPRTGAEERKAS
jgi:two-component system, NtrC family, sensor kinase